MVSPEIIGPLFDGNDLVAKAIARIQQFTPPEGLYVAFSGGKDSVVLLDLVRKAGVKHDVHYNLTTVDPPELVHFIRKEYPDVQVHRPAMTMWQLIVKKRVPPDRVKKYCCRELKEKGGQGRTVATGVRWAESSRRGKRRMVELCFHSPDRKLFHPIIDWAEADVWLHIRRHGLPVCSLYGEGQKRIGCVMCPQNGSKGMKRHADRWPKIADAYKRAFQRCIDKRIADGLETTWKTGQDMYDWWVEDSDKEEEDPNPWLFE
jgi:phosphoadenosine phosphosulfate reductase